MKEKSGGRLLVAGTGSGCGKTTVMCGLLYGFKQRGLDVRSYKCGPDYIDPMFHRKVLGIPTGNLDSYFTDREVLRNMVGRGCAGSDIVIMEGVMGYYDGIGMTERASSHEIAGMTGTPAILVVNGSGMANSVGALLRGFCTYDDSGCSMLKGVIFNQVSAKMYEKLARTAVQEGMCPLGYVPRQEIFSMKSRHLGLMMPGEMQDFQDRLKGFYEMIKETVDWNGLLALSREAVRLNAGMESCSVEEQEPVCRIAIARDEAFCFLYEDNLRYLEEKRCEIVFFSPIHDKTIPEDIDGLILPGGYPELYAEALSENVSMRRSVRDRLSGGLPCIAECGGYLYLQKELMIEHGTCFEMVGFFPGRGKKEAGLHHFGYVKVTLKPEGHLFGRNDICFRAHEFHYYNCEASSGDFLAEKASGEGSWSTGAASDTIYAGFPHLYFYGNGEFTDSFLKKCREYSRRGIN